MTEKNARYCAQCGTGLEQGTRFCMSCGTQAGTAASPQAATAPEERDNQSAFKTVQVRGIWFAVPRKSTVSVLGALLAVLLFGGFARAGNRTVSDDFLQGSWRCVRATPSGLRVARNMDLDNGRKTLSIGHGMMNRFDYKLDGSKLSTYWAHLPSDLANSWLVQRQDANRMTLEGIGDSRDYSCVRVDS